ncbi:hypothetical protein [Methylopila sp. M107]|uniref:hypothetical protein n=1 Tax=Methylopila sp. M107 TaxID=1101190 RepID=UPI00035E464A|nr:hypothetical protein [Methylopila sp. M107]
MTGAMSRFGGLKAVMAALAILYAAASLAVLATATPAGDRQAQALDHGAADPQQNPSGAAPSR